MELVLKIHDGSETFEYTDVRLLEQDMAVETRVQDRQIELSDVLLEVGPRPDGTSTLIGETSLEALPIDQRYRALLEDGAGNTVLDGAIRTEDISWSDGLQTFSVRLFDRAPREVWETLEKEFVDMLALVEFVENSTTPSELRSVEIDTYFEVEEGGAATDVQLEPGVTWHHLRSVAKMVLSKTVDSYNLPDPLWTHEYKTTGGTVTEDADPLLLGRGYKGLPTFDCRSFFEQLLDLCGLWLDAEYASFPSTDLDVSFVDATAPDPGPSIDGVELADAHDRKPTRQVEYALQYAGDVAEPSPDRTEVDYETFESTSPVHPAPPPSYGTLAPRLWRAEEVCVEDLLPVTYKDPRSPDLEDVRQVEFRLANVVVDSTETRTVAGTDRDYTWGLPHVEMTPVNGWDRLDSNLNRSGFGDFRLVGNCDGPHAVLASRFDPDVSRTDHAVEWGSELASPGTDQFSRVNASWARVPYEKHDLLSLPYYELAGNYRLSAVTDFGVLDDIDAEGASWALWERERDLQTDSDEIVLRRPVPGTDAPAALPSLPDDPATVWRVLRLTPVVRYLTVDQGDEDWLIVHWEPPFTQEARTWAYEIEVKDSNGDEWDQGVWTSLATRHATGHSERLGLTSGDYDLSIRVRPVAPDGTTGVWESRNASLVDQE